MLLIPNKLLMIKPKFFKINEQAVPTNKFMNITERIHILQENVEKEHHMLYSELIDKKFDVHIFDNNNVETPDALFCNNWISVHHPNETSFNNSVSIIYPMAIPNRRLEVREDIINYIDTLYNNMISIDLRFTNDWAYLESTGSMVFDRHNKIIYASLSPRTYYWKLIELKDLLNYKLIQFNTAYKQAPVYHTNVLMSIGANWAVVCFDVISECYHTKIKDSLEQNNKKVIEINSFQMTQYCGNIIEIVNKEGIPYTIMSTTAYNAFKEEQLKLLGNIIHVPFEHIEKFGGGGVRCCIAEI